MFFDIKKDTSLDGVGRGNNRIPHGVSSDVSKYSISQLNNSVNTVPTLPNIPDSNANNQSSDTDFLKESTDEMTDMATAEKTAAEMRDFVDDPELNLEKLSELGRTSPVISSSPKVVQSFISREESSTARKLKYYLPVSYSMLDRVMSKSLRTISEELMRTGDVSRPTIQRAFL